MKKNTILLSTLIVVLFSACGKKEPEPQVNDLLSIPQNPSIFTKDIQPVDKNFQIKEDKKFNEKYFRPWSINKLSYTLKQATWGHYYSKKEMYGFNKQPLKKEWFEKHINNADYKKFDTVRKKAITVKNSHLRVFPTSRFMMGDPNEAGEGYPFDYNQVSSIKINTPLFISHYSKDKAWVLVETNFALGWIKSEDIAIVDKRIVKLYKNSKLSVAIKDDFPIYKKDTFKEYIKLGTIFPKLNENYMMVEKDHNQKAKIYLVKDKNIVKKPIPFTPKNIEKISDQLLTEPYGWGGILHSRDCSAMTRDFFIPFGIYLQRNSYGQIQDHNYISLENYTNDEKKNIIKQKAKPYKTLLYLKGHIMLYVGTFKNEPIAMHQSWGIKTIDENGIYGRNIIGKTAITTLEVGKELSDFDEDSSLLNRLKGMVLIL